MESVNTSTNETLGVVENLPLDFGTVKKRNLNRGENTGG
jgi:hypothetical protein